MVLLLGPIGFFKKKERLMEGVRDRKQIDEIYEGCVGPLDCYTDQITRAEEERTHLFG